MNRGISRVSAALALVTLAGCTVGPDHVPPKVDTPQTFDALSQVPQGTDTTPIVGEPRHLADWWKLFKDPVLESLADRALAANLDLKIAQARVREARAALGVTEADLYPTVNAEGGVQMEQFSSHTGVTQPGYTDTHNLIHAGFDASWELDFFGRVRRQVEAADAGLGATIDALADTQVTLLGDVASTYAQLRAAQQRLELAISAVKSRQDTLELVESRFKAGVVGELDVAQARAELASRASAIPDVEAQARRLIYSLSLLLGQPPATLVSELSPEGVIPVAPGEIPVGLPSDLLRRRPDVRQAERQLAAATALVGVATADLFPRFTLNGTFELQARNVKDLGDLNSRAWSVGPSFSWPLFDAGRVRQQINVQTARQEQAADIYTRTVLGAFGDVESSMVSLVKEQTRRAALRTAVDADTRAVDLAMSLYTSKIADFTTVLDNQRRLYDAQDALIQSELSVTNDLISLFKSLGGGWTVPEDANKDSQAAPAKS